MNTKGKLETYYDGIFVKGDDKNWEGAPGKNVLLDAIRHHFGRNRFSADASIIDIGCGSGFLLNRIRNEVASNQFRLMGVDFSAEAIEKGKLRYSGIDLFCEDGSRTHFKAGTFEIVISYGTFEHFREPKSGIDELSRLLVQGGQFFCMMPALGIDRTDRDDEGYYEERQVPNSPIRQMQWNLRRETWAAYFEAAHLRLYPTQDAAMFGAIKPGVFFFGEKQA